VLVHLSLLNVCPAVLADYKMHSLCRGLGALYAAVADLPAAVVAYVIPVYFSLASFTCVYQSNTFVFHAFVAVQSNSKYLFL